MKSIMWPTQTLCRCERMSKSLKWNSLQNNSWKESWGWTGMSRLCLGLWASSWEWLPWVSWSFDLHHQGVWPCSRVLKTKQTERFCWCQQINVLCQIQHTRREWRLNGDFSNSRLFETCSLELILLRGMKRTRVFVVKHSAHTGCGRKHKNLRAMFSATINWQMFLTSDAPELIYIRWGCSPWLVNCEEQCHNMSITSCSPAELSPARLCD